MILHQQYGQSALWCAAFANKTECAKVLLKFGAQVDLAVKHLMKWIQGKDGNTPLVEACRRGHVEMARILLDHGANVDYQNQVHVHLFIRIIDNIFTK